MITALGLEIDAIEKKGGASTIEVTGGQLKGKYENGCLYVFPISTEIYLRDDSPIKIVVGKDEADGTVVSFGEGILVISCEQDFGPRIPFARIVTNDSFLVERLRDKLKEVNEGPGDFNSITAQQVIGDRPCNTSDGTVDERVFFSGDPLNEEQKRSVEKALGSDITYIWGPPGTGKTTVLARIVEGYYYAGLSVLLVSNTNIAVDTALEKVAERLRTDQGFQQGTVLRHGPIVKHELKRDYGDRVEIEKVVNRLGERLTQQKATLESEKRAVEQESNLYKEAINNWCRFEESQNQLENFEESLRQSKTKQQTTGSVIESLETKIESLQSDLQRSLKMGSIHKFFVGLNTNSLRKKLTDEESDLLYLDTRSYHPWTSMRIGTYSRYNLFHALVIRNFVYSLYKEEYLADNRRVGVISPYSAQARLIERLVNDHIDDRDHIVVSTVHRFQGNEKDVIVVDITDSLGVRPSKFVRAVDRKEDGTRLLNVALSRAKSHIILVANFDYLRQKISSESVIRRVADLFVKRGIEIKIDTVLPLGPDDWIDGLRDIEHPTFDFDDSKSGIFNEGTFFIAFKEDLLKAEKSVVVFSPFLTQNGAGRLMEIISQKTFQGVPVRLVTRPPGDQGGILEEGLVDLVHDMTNAGVVVDYRARMHEKFAVLDNKILWYGSLNIFSHRDTSESMFRIVSPSICEQIAQFIIWGYDKKKKEASDVNLTEKENPDCPNCSKPMVWKNGRYGIYYECTICGTKVDPRRSRQRGRTRSRGDTSDKKCSVCGKQMRKRKGKYGWFWGCTGFPRCKNTEKL
ncbi:MAG: AAA domain-containing protein [Planctomycetota bacterium]